MDTPFVRRESTDLVVVDSSRPRYVADNAGIGALAVPFVLAVPLVLVSVMSAIFIGWEPAWHLFLGGGVLLGGVGVLIGLAAGAHATRHLIRLEFSPADDPEVVLVRPLRSRRLPLSRLERVRVITALEAAWGDDDPEPAKVEYVIVEVHTAGGVERTPPKYRVDPDVVAGRLAELLAAAGVPLERETIVERTRRRAPDLESWWPDGRVAEEWGIAGEQAGSVAYRLRVERVYIKSTRTFSGYPRSSPEDVGRVTAAIADGSLVRAVAGELLAEIEAGGRPLTPKPTPRTPVLTVFLPDAVAGAYALAADRQDHARRVLAETVLGEPAPDGESLDETVRRALRHRPNLPYGRSDLPIL